MIEPMGEHEKTLLHWLKAHGPDDWHQVAIDWNWGAGVAILAWIAGQPQCDRATAQHIIVHGGADYYVRFADREALVAEAYVNVEGFDLLAPVIERWNADFYTRSEIASYERGGLKREARNYRIAVTERAEQPMPWRLDPDVFEPLEGRAFSYRYTEGWPPEVEAELKARGIHY